MFLYWRGVVGRVLLGVGQESQSHTSGPQGCPRQNAGWVAAPICGPARTCGESRSSSLPFPGSLCLVCEGTGCHSPCDWRRGHLNQHRVRVWSFALPGCSTSWKKLRLVQERPAGSPFLLRSRHILCKGAGPEDSDGWSMASC